jgi:hypothetical protein
MAATLDALGSKLNLIGPSLMAYKLEVTTWCETLIKSNQEQFYKRLEDFKLALIGATRALSGRLDNVEIGLLSQAQPPTVERASLSYTTGTGMMGKQTIDRLSREPIQAPI